MGRVAGRAVRLAGQDLAHDPLMVRATYARTMVHDAVVAGVTEHGDDFRLAVEQDTSGAGDALAEDDRRSDA